MPTAKELRDQSLARCKIVMDLRRNDGLTFKAIGERFNVTGARARQMFCKGERMERHGCYK